jgi:hypothetical protein
MTKIIPLVGGMVLGAVLAVTPRLWAHAHRALAPDTRPLLHTEHTFGFTVAAPADVVGPLFGANRERVWAPGWHPRFLWPPDAADQPGMVFAVSHGHASAIWVNTAFDLTAHYAQYVYTIPDVMVTVISLHWLEQADSTHVTVRYDRTALDPAANATVEHMATYDAASGPDWAQQIGAYLLRSASH